MTPKQRRDFETEWPGLAKKLDGFLARRGVPSARREDLIQETAARLFRCWPSVDRSIPVGALACTIVMNLLRDESRRRPMQFVAEVPDSRADCDVERAGIARIELQKVAAALASLNGAQRAVLLQEIGEASALEFTTSDAEKMMRMRARRKLSTILERMAGVVSLRFVRFLDFASALVPSREGALGALTCAACLFVGVGGSVVMSSPEANASNMLIRRPVAATTTVRSDSEVTGRHVRSLDGAVSPGDAASRDARSGTGTKGSDPKAGSVQGSTIAGGSAVGGGTTGSSGGAPSVGVAPVGSPSAPDVPGTAAPDAPELPEAPAGAPVQTPSLPSGPKPDESPPDIEGVLEAADNAVAPTGLDV